MGSAIRELNRGIQDPARSKHSGAEIFESILAEESRDVGSVLRQGLERVSALQMQARELRERMARGEPVEVHEILVAGEKAGVAFRMMLEVRNKLMDLWKEITRLPV